MYQHGLACHGEFRTQIDQTQSKQIASGVHLDEVKDWALAAGTKNTVTNPIKGTFRKLA